MRVAILDDYTGVVSSLDAYQKLASHEVTIFHEHARGLALAERLRGFEAIVLLQQRCPIDAAVLERLPELRFISQTGRNLGHLDVKTALARGIVISAGGAGAPHATAELTWALILAARRHLPAAVEALRAGRWQTQDGRALHGQTLGVWAFGRIGARVAEVGRALGMQVLCWGRGASLVAAEKAGFARATSKQELFARADVLTLHLPLSAETRGIVRGEDLEAMRTDALLVNTSRAALVETEVLARALDRGRPGALAVDVFDDEPIAKDHPLLQRPNVLCTPHLGYAERGTLEQYFSVAFDQVNAYAAGAPINVVTSPPPP